ncbi:hypothetical protein L596_028727 [Steinernema carpocapsae]|uniref:Peptidase M12A domain-containing protein n=1 Tax=Steinernema carpocapsae TaxID=34508 RepID=A0A4U5LZ73_STECR|nr:hypothetical protein L596_028727 [Steinernema carpocapsae]
MLTMRSLDILVFGVLLIVLGTEACQPEDGLGLRSGAQVPGVVGEHSGGEITIYTNEEFGSRRDNIDCAEQMEFTIASLLKMDSNFPWGKIFKRRIQRDSARKNETATKKDPMNISYTLRSKTECIPFKQSVHMIYGVLKEYFQMSKIVISCDGSEVVFPKTKKGSVAAQIDQSPKTPGVDEDNSGGEIRIYTKEEFGTRRENVFYAEQIEFTIASLLKMDTYIPWETIFKRRLEKDPTQKTDSKPPKDAMNILYTLGGKRKCIPFKKSVLRIHRELSKHFKVT